jgi:hypothetical protein
MKVTLDTPNIASTRSNLCLLINVKTLLRLNAIMPFLETIHYLIKFVQLDDIFVCDFIIGIKKLSIRCISNVLWQPLLFPL